MLLTQVLLVSQMIADLFFFAVAVVVGVGKGMRSRDGHVSPLLDDVDRCIPQASTSGRALHGSHHPPPPRLVYSAGEVARILGVSRLTARRLAKRGVLPRVPHTRRLLIPASGLAEHIAGSSGVGSRGAERRELDRAPQ